MTNIAESLKNEFKDQLILIALIEVIEQEAKTIRYVGDKEELQALKISFFAKEEMVREAIWAANLGYAATTKFREAVRLIDNAAYDSFQWCEKNLNK